MPWNLGWHWTLPLSYPKTLRLPPVSTVATHLGPWTISFTGISGENTFVTSWGLCQSGGVYTYICL